MKSLSNLDDFQLNQHVSMRVKVVKIEASVIVTTKNGRVVKKQECKMCRWKWFLQASTMREIHWLCSSGKVSRFSDCYSLYVSRSKVFVNIE